MVRVLTGNPLNSPNHSNNPSSPLSNFAPNHSNPAPTPLTTAPTYSDPAPIPPNLLPPCSESRETTEPADKEPSNINLGSTDEPALEPRPVNPPLDPAQACDIETRHSSHTQTNQHSKDGELKTDAAPVSETGPEPGLEVSGDGEQGGEASEYCQSSNHSTSGD